MLSLVGDDLLSMLPTSSYETPVIRLGGKTRTIFVVSDPASIKSILVDDVHNFPKSTSMINAFRPLLGNGLVISEGEHWKRHRAMLEPAFVRMRITQIFPFIQHAFSSFSKRVADGAATSLRAEMSALALDVIYRAVMSSGAEEREAKAIYEAFTAYQHLVPEAQPMHLIGRAIITEETQAALISASETIRGLITELVERRTRSKHDKKTDILQSIIDAKDPSGKGFSIEEIVDEVAVFITAGHETSANALTWAVFLVSQQQDLAASIRDEVQSVSPDQFIRFEDVSRLETTRRVFLETLRLYPPGAFLARTAAAATNLHGEAVPKGALIIISPWIVHRHRTLWEEPDDFKPERFSAELERKIVPGSYIPFGWGPRLCTGRLMAMSEVPFLIAEIFRRFDVEVDSPQDVTPISRLMLMPSGDIQCRFLSR